ncbi:MAG: glycosyltransferase family 4 protein [Candidatus Woesebacteria bacterium]|nr:MAG: glycosyltransferase family 4 protein [Candidatus Woesebacteria bacterium]
MKIAFVSFYNGEIFRGVETYVHELANRFVDMGYEVVVYQNGPKIPLTKYKTKEIRLKIDWNKRPSKFLKVIYFDYWNLLVGKFTLKLAISIFNEKPKIIISGNGGWQPAILRIITWLYGGKLIISSQAGIGFDDINNLFCFPNVFVAISTYAQMWAKKINPLVRVEKISNGVDMQKFQPKGEKLDINLPSPIILSVGALTQMKRHELSIKAFLMVKKGSLLIVGQGELYEYLTKLAKQMIPGRFKILNLPYKEIDKAYRSADLFIYPTSNYESFGISMLEAMASGLPVVANDDPIRKEIIGNAGLVVNPQNSESYAKAIEKALDTSWGNKPREQVEKFDWDKIALDYVNLFKSL